MLFPSTKEPGKPADQKSHDARDNETVDMATGIGKEDGQLLDNDSIDPDEQDKLKGFPK